MSPSALEGQTLGKYRVLDALGRGGMARVYRGYHPQLDRHVAIKVLRVDLMERKDFLERFRREAHAVSGLRHTNIVQIFDFDVQNDTYFMVMELLKGDTLRARLNEYRLRGERMPLGEVTRIMSDVLDGLEYAHSEGVIHRDIKPANILLTEKGQAVLTDFGIAQIMGTTKATVSGALMGTLNYMAPEQGLEGRCDVRSDIYSLGIVFYEMLTGYTPFDADTPLAILMKHLSDPLPLPSQLDPSLPGDFEGLALKALAKDPKHRFQSAGEMSAQLSQLKRDQFSEVRQQVSPPEQHAPQIVYSGNARQRLENQPGIKDDTDPEIAPTPSAASKSRSTDSKSFLKIISNPPSVIGAVLTSLGLFMIFNLFAGMITAVTDMNVYQYGWAFEIFLAAGFFTLLAWSLQLSWLLTPAVILFGNAVLLAYSSVTGRWSDWVFLWMFEPLIIAAAILGPLYLNNRPELRVNWIRATSFLFSILAILLATVTCWLSFVTSLFR